MGMTDRKLKMLIGSAEPSGELHLIRLIKELQNGIGKQNIEAYAVGSKKRLEKYDKNIIVPDYFDVSGQSLVGFLEYIFSPFAILRWIRVFIRVEKFIEEYQKPDIFIAITSFFSNIVIGYILKKKGVKCIYYMPPQIWAWGQWRLHFIKNIFDEVLTNFSFEALLYQKEVEKVVHFGYPTPIYHSQTNEINAESRYREEFNIPADKKILLLLPGSRKIEIKRLLPIFLEALKIS